MEYITIENKSGMKAVISSFGATLVSLYVKDKKGILRDVVLGYEDIEGYRKDDSNFGATVGRNCNRIANACFELDGIMYQLEANDGPNNLHSGNDYYKWREYDIRKRTDDSVTMAIKSPDGDQGYPGNLDFSVRYTVTDRNVLRIEYEAVGDKDTLVNATNHSYFNLSGHDAGPEASLNQTLLLMSDEFTVLGPGTIPTGELRKVDGTPFDFREPTRIGLRIDEEDEQLKLCHGYDHNFVIRGDEREFREVAVLTSEDGTLAMKVSSDCPGIQVYTANYLTDTKGKNGAVYKRRGAVCLETQFFPDAVNKQNFTTPLLKKGDTYYSRTEYGFFHMI